MTPTLLIGTLGRALSLAHGHTVLACWGVSSHHGNSHQAAMTYYSANVWMNKHWLSQLGKIYLAATHFTHVGTSGMCLYGYCCWLWTRWLASISHYHPLPTCHVCLLFTAAAWSMLAQNDLKWRCQHTWGLLTRSAMPMLHLLCHGYGIDLGIQYDILPEPEA